VVKFLFVYSFISFACPKETCLRRSGYAQAGEPKKKTEKTKLSTHKAIPRPPFFSGLRFFMLVIIVMYGIIIFIMLVLDLRFVQKFCNQYCKNKIKNPKHVNA